MEQNKIFPSIWVQTNNGKISDAINYYKNVFSEKFIVKKNTQLGNTPSGFSETSEIEFFGRKYSIMTTEKEHHKLNDAFSLVINCVDQNEIDNYWNYFTKNGEESQCAWCIDKFGLRWQIIPQNMGKLMYRPNTDQIMMSQKKIVIEEYLK